MHKEEAVVYLQVPKEERREAKRLCAKWDRDANAWYVPRGMDLQLVAKWLPVDAAGNTVEYIPVKPPAEKRYYLSIPYDLRHIAKVGGAKWDNEKKLWYATPASDLPFLEEWLPKDYFDEIVVAADPREEFAGKLRSIGLLITGEHPIADGKSHRVASETDKKGETSGTYTLYPNRGSMGGHGINYRTGDKITWLSKSGKQYSPEQRKVFVVQIKEKRIAAMQEQRQLHLEAAQKAQQAINALYQPITTPTPYLLKKHIAITKDTYTDAEGKLTCIPHYDITGFIWCLTYIFEDGSKKYSKNGKKSGCFHVINGFDQLASLPRLVIAEGYSTAATLTEAMGFSAIAAFDNGNLLAVAKTLHEHFPDKPIVIAGDDDRSVEKSSLRKNPGREKAIEAANAVQGRAVFPLFTPEEMVENSKNYTDWNDLAHRSTVGKQAFLRQVRQGVLGDTDFSEN